MRLRLWSLFAALAMVVAAGCIQEKREYTLNPDGTGKLVYTATLPLSGFGNDDTDPEAQMKKMVSELLEQSEGVAAWKDVSYKLNDEGKVDFQATAYFKSLNNLVVRGSMHRTGGPKAKWEVLPDGGRRVFLADKKKTEREVEDEKAPPTLSEEELAKKIKVEKAKYEQVKPMMAMMMTGLRMEFIFHLPGTPKTVTAFEKKDNTVSLVYEGDKVLKALEEMTADENFWKEQVRAGGNMRKDGPDDAELRKRLFGTNDQPAAVMKGDMKPLFDFTAEVKQAQKEFSALQKKLKLPQTAEKLPAATGEGFKSLRIGGVQIVRESHQRNRVRPFNQNKGMKLSLIGELPGAVMKMKEGRVTAAITDTEDDLTPAREFQAKIHWPRLSEDGRFVVFEINLQLPGPDSTYFQRIAGDMTYTVSKDTKTVDLGITEFKVGAAGKALESRIEKREIQKWNKEYETLAVKLKAAEDSIKKITLYDEGGLEIKARQGGTSQMNDEYTVTLMKKGTFPQKGSVKVELYDKLQEFKIPWEVKNVNFDGTLRKGEE